MAFREHESKGKGTFQVVNRFDPGSGLIRDRDSVGSTMIAAAGVIALILVLLETILLISFGRKRHTKPSHGQM
jgi:hypothetical protein